MVTILAHLEGDRLVERHLAALEHRLGDASPAWPAVIAVFREIVQQAFATEGASTGQPWEPLKPATVADRARKGFPAGPILQRTQRLYRSLMLREESIVVETPRYLALGSDVEYFAFHQSKRPRTKLPRRAVINLTADDRSRLIQPLRLWFTGHDPSGERRSGIQ